ncbi:MAG: T9SS type A sorting domain-containing protein [Lacibacter sp.]
MNNGSYVSDAPFYRNGSSLIYNINGGYARNVEWGSSANQGYPHHVIVQGNTILDLNTHTIAPAELTLGGDLIIGNSTGRGEVYMNNSMNKRLVVRGNLIIGSTGVAAANNSRLRLSDVIGGDLVLHGNFVRHSNGLFDDVGRATFLRGTTNTTISTPGVTPAPDATTQNFSYLYIDKNSAAQTITLNCPVGINNLIDFSNGIVVSSAANFLQINNGATAAGASFNSFVHGTVRKVGTQDFLFPTGFLDVTTPHYRPIGISSLSGANTFIAEFVRGNPRNLGPISAAATAAGLSTISGCEYWNLSRLNASNTARVTLSWSNDNRGLSNCNVGASAYVKPGNEAGLRVVPFNNSNQWGDVFGNDGVTITPSISTITWNGPIPTYTRFVLGSIDWRFNPLPFRFTQFTATGRGKQAQLDWSVQANANILTYTIERGSDGRTFSPIFSINSNTEAGSTSYRQYDATAPSGWNYYRLRATDHLGEHHFSAIQKVWLGSGAFFQMGPNPASNTLNVTIGAGSNWRQVQVTNAVGQVLLQQPALQGTRSFDLSKLPAGMYYLRLLGDSGTEVHPFVKE